MGHFEVAGWAYDANVMKQDSPLMVVILSAGGWQPLMQATWSMWLLVILYYQQEQQWRLISCYWQSTTCIISIYHAFRIHRCLPFCLWRTSDRILLSTWSNQPSHPYTSVRLKFRRSIIIVWSCNISRARVFHHVHAYLALADMFIFVSAQQELS